MMPMTLSMRCLFSFPLGATFARLTGFDNPVACREPAIQTDRKDGEVHMATSAEYGLGEYAFPRGWFAVANAAEARRKPTAVRYFGQDLVLYRGASGRPVLLDAYCPHMGTHLASGENSATS